MGLGRPSYKPHTLANENSAAKPQPNLKSGRPVASQDGNVIVRG